MYLVHTSMYLVHTSMYQHVAGKLRESYWTIIIGDVGL
jgi:hypothetical protein